MTLNVNQIRDHFFDNEKYYRGTQGENGQEILVEMPLVDFIMYLYRHGYQLNNYSFKGSVSKFQGRLQKLARILLNQQPQPAPEYVIQASSLNSWQLPRGRYPHESSGILGGIDSKHPERRRFNILFQTGVDTTQFYTNPLRTITLQLPWFVHNKDGVENYEEITLKFSPQKFSPPILTEFNNIWKRLTYVLINYTKATPRILTD